MSQRARTFADVAGSILGLSCALHCVTLAALPVLLMWSAPAWADSEAAEWGLTAASVIISALAAAWAYRAHASKHVLGLFALGLGALLLGRLAESGGLSLAPLFSIGGGLLLFGAHVRSIKVRRAAQCPCPSPA